MKEWWDDINSASLTVHKHNETIIVTPHLILKNCFSPSTHGNINTNLPLPVFVGMKNANVYRNALQAVKSGSIK